MYFPRYALDLLKARGYGSDGKPKAWWIDLNEANFHSEMAYLRDTIYGRTARVSTSAMNAFNRFSDRLSIMSYPLPTVQ